jgi:hypothetical protein
VDDDDYGGVEYKKRREREAEAKKTDSKFNISRIAMSMMNHGASVRCRVDLKWNLALEPS